MSIVYCVDFRDPHNLSVSFRPSQAIYEQSPQAHADPIINIILSFIPHHCGTVCYSLKRYLFYPLFSILSSYYAAEKKIPFLSHLI